MPRRCRGISLPPFAQGGVWVFLYPCFFSSFASIRVNSYGRGQVSSTGSWVRGWMKRRPVAWRHWPVRPGTGFFAP